MAKGVTKFGHFRLFWKRGVTFTQNIWPHCLQVVNVLCPRINLRRKTSNFPLLAASIPGKFVSSVMNLLGTTTKEFPGVVSTDQNFQLKVPKGRRRHCRRCRSPSPSLSSSSLSSMSQPLPPQRRQSVDKFFRLRMRACKTRTSKLTDCLLV